ncbi:MULTISPECIES: metalloregulator ArsR/SmtB family transcription factor [unclassified Streptomyces]|uniref:ArsR/SmtB family transcription factor n=1 Tax=unclassified Streptomyces TaxID=2593676 RepID=UPI002366E742|nr:MULTISPECIES: metalloregulator ArsR/SmtB family transcription factor [unclassified Streptomyces]MDF3139959.1 metalloregulator ArsR/SmtB family transcription factor [Streptomyces sp. T21Q-yed]WDF39901.1 metalloregulator ArsR/SmtB family transcription factor [Streptomyces sp. T12]
MPAEQVTDQPSGLLPFIDEDPTCGPPLNVDPLPRARAEALARNLKGISDPTRLQILSILLAAPEGEACVCDLTPLLGLAQPTVSGHMKVLLDAGLVSRRKRGTWAWYSVSPERRTVLDALIWDEQADKPGRAIPEA